MADETACLQEAEDETRVDTVWTGLCFVLLLPVQQSGLCLGISLQSLKKSDSP